MSASPESQPLPPKTGQHQENTDWVRDVMLWRRKDGGVLVLAAATVTWVAMEVYDFKLVTLVSWLAMALVLSLFAWGNLNRLFNRESPDLSRFEISEQRTAKAATRCNQRINDAIRMTLHLGTESEWFAFAGIMVSLYALSLLGSYLDFLTVCYIGIVGGLTVPVLYVKNEEKINECFEKLRVKFERWYFMCRDEVQKMINKLTGKHKEPVKEKKME